MSILRRILLILLLSVVLTFAVAWCCAWWRPAPGGATQMPSFFKQPDGTTWMGPGQVGLGWTQITLYGATGFTAHGLEQAAWLPKWIQPPTEGPLDERAMYAIRAGWPARCLRARIIGRGDDSPGPGGVFRTGLGPQRVHWNQWEQAIIVDDRAPDASQYRVLPRGIIATGAILNLLVWSIPGVLIAAACSLRRAVRRRRCLCPACGYPVGRSDACTECGAPVIP